MKNCIERTLFECEKEQQHHHHQSNTKEKKKFRCMHKGFEHKERYTTTSNTIKLTSDKKGKKTNGFQIDTPYKK